MQALGSLIVAAVEGDRMPPWPASSECHEIAESRRLPEATKQLFVAWKDADYREGDAGDYKAPEKPRRLDLGEPTQSRAPAEPYTPEVNSDTYRCFFIGRVETDTYLTALDIVPGVRAEVHHVQLHRIDEANVATIEARDADAEGSGYPCGANGSGVRTQNLFSYRPGALAVLLPPGDAIYLQSGSGLMLQLHYNTQFLPESEPPSPDQTRIDLWTLPEGTMPERVIYRTGVLSPLSASGNGDLSKLAGSVIPAGERTVGETTLPMGKVSVIGSGLVSANSTAEFVAGEIVGVTPHAHAWATRMQASIQQSDQEKCLIEVPDWDYAWQLDYMYAQGVPYGPDDVLHVSCDYDNTLENQPIINGQRKQVADITFGENTLNEMCLHYFWLRFTTADFLAAKR